MYQLQGRRCFKHWGIDIHPLTSYLREYIGNLAEKAQRASDFGNMKIVCNIIKQLSGKYNKSSGETANSKDGRILTTENEVAERWKTHF